jgi:hypothetical protein
MMCDSIFSKWIAQFHLQVWTQAYQIQGTSVSKTKVIQKKVNRIMKIMQSIIWFAYWIMLEILNFVISDIIDVLPQKGSSYFT